MTQPDSIAMPYDATLLPQAGASILQILPSHCNWHSSGSSIILATPSGV